MQIYSMIDVPSEQLKLFGLGLPKGQERSLRHVLMTLPKAGIRQPKQISQRPAMGSTLYP